MEVTGEIMKTFKLAADLKVKFKNSNKVILEEDHSEEDDYILKYFSV